MGPDGKMVGDPIHIDLFDDIISICFFILLAMDFKRLESWFCQMIKF